MTARPPSCQCGCHAAPPPYAPVVNVTIYAPSVEHPTPTVVVNSAAPDADDSIGADDRVLLRRLAREVAEVKTRLASVEASHASFKAKRQRRAIPNAEPIKKEMATNTSLLLLDTSDSEASCSDLASDSEYEPNASQVVRRRPSSQSSTGPRRTEKAPMKTARSGRGATCSVDGCRSLVRANGLCRRHGTNCSEPGCDKCFYANAKCGRHGGKRLCSESGCASVSICHGKCWRHGGVPPCAVTACASRAWRAGKCRRHNRDASTVS